MVKLQKGMDTTFNMLKKRVLLEWKEMWKEKLNST